jgi:hypothetical protein
MSDELYYPFKSKWLGKWRTARYLCTLDQLEKRFGPGEYEIIGPGERRSNPYGPNMTMCNWGSGAGMVWQRGKPPPDEA